MKQIKVNLSDDVYAEVEREAQQRSLAPDQAIEEAILDWLGEARQDVEELPLIRERLASYDTEGGIPLEDVLKERGLE